MAQSLRTANSKPFRLMLTSRQAYALYELAKSGNTHALRDPSPRIEENLMNAAFDVMKRFEAAILKAEQSRL